MLLEVALVELLPALLLPPLRVLLPLLLKWKEELRCQPGQSASASGLCASRAARQAGEGGSISGDSSTAPAPVTTGPPIRTSMIANGRRMFLFPAIRISHPRRAEPAQSAFRYPTTSNITCWNISSVSRRVEVL